MSPKTSKRFRKSISSRQCQRKSFTRFPSLRISPSTQPAVDHRSSLSPNSRNQRRSAKRIRINSRPLEIHPCRVSRKDSIRKKQREHWKQAQAIHRSFARRAKAKKNERIYRWNRNSIINRLRSFGRSSRNFTKRTRHPHLRHRL